MRSQDLLPGQLYVLHGGRGTKVTVLETPPELRRRARVRVRFETGVKAGEVSDLPSRRIAARWNDEPQPARPRRSRPPRPTLVAVTRSPQVGERVTWTQTAGLVWTVEELDEAAGQATINGVIFGRPMTRTVALDQLRVHARDSEPDEPPDLSVKGLQAAVADQSRATAGAAVPPDHLRPFKPRRALDELLDDVLFSRECLEGYGRRFAPGVKGTALSERLREEIRRKGYVELRSAEAGEYARLRVPGRFDVVLKTRPSPDDPVMVTGLYYPSKRQAPDKNKNRPRGSRPAARHPRRAA